MKYSPKISIVIPIHKSMKYGEYFLWRAVQSIMDQSFKDYEIVIVQEGSMPVNTNAGIKKARGELIKLLYMDDYFAHPQALQDIVDFFDKEDEWMATPCLHQRYSPEYYEDPHSDHYPEYTQDIHTGNNRIGSPSVITLRNHGEETLLFDGKLSFLLDCDLYKRLYEKFGEPRKIAIPNVIIGIHDGQTSNIMPDRDKLLEFEYLQKKYE